MSAAGLTPQARLQGEQGKEAAAAVAEGASREVSGRGCDVRVKSPQLPFLRGAPVGQGWPRDCNDLLEPQRFLARGRAPGSALWAPGRDLDARPGRESAREGRGEGIPFRPASPFLFPFRNAPAFWQLGCYKDRLSKLPLPPAFFLGRRCTTPSPTFL